MSLIKKIAWGDYCFITDLYDFNFKGFALALANNYAIYMLNQGLIKKYNIELTLTDTIKTYFNKGSVKFYC